MQSQWTDCPGYADRYKVSRDGRVYSLKSHKELRPGPTSKGYLSVCLYDGSSPKRPVSLLVHRLVWIGFNGEIPKGLEINHKDGNKENNRLDNLEAVTPKQNHEHARDILGHGIGIKNGRAKLTDEQITQILESSDKPKAIAKRFNISEGYVRQLRSGQYRKVVLRKALDVDTQPSVTDHA